jgi:hypothetical protein
MADITGFNPSRWTRNNDYRSATNPSIIGGVLTVTDGAGNEHTSAIYNKRQSITAFTAQFTYHASGAADGATFVVENDPGGVHALGRGDGGSGLGYNGMTSAAAYEINIFSGHTIGTNFVTDGSTGNYNSTSPLSPASGDAIQVTLTYSGTTMHESLLDTNTSATYSHDYTSIDLSSVVGAPTAFIGFTGGTGSASSVQTFSQFSFHTPASPAPEPSALGLAGLGGIGVAGSVWRRRRRAAA